MSKDSLAAVLFGNKTAIDSHKHREDSPHFILPPGLNPKHSEFSGQSRVDFESHQFEEGARSEETGREGHRKDSVRDVPSKKKSAITVLKEDKDTRWVGRLKFVNQKGKFGFIVKEEDGSDVFFHFSELEKSKIRLNELDLSGDVFLTFTEVVYVGKHEKSKKAVDIRLL